jgi:hypothetical protein
MQDLRDTRIEPLITKSYRVLSANLPLHPLPLCSIPRQGRRRSKRAKLPVAHAFSGSATVGKRKRKSRGPSFGAHRRRRGAGAAGIKGQRRRLGSGSRGGGGQAAAARAAELEHARGQAQAAAR